MLKLALLLGLMALPLGGQQALVDQGYSNFYNLEFDQAIAEFEHGIAQNPGFPRPAQSPGADLVFREMFRNGALESELVSGNNSFLRRPKLNPSPETEKRILDEIAKAMALAEARLKKNPKDTAAMYAQGISYGLRSNYYWVVKKSWRDSLQRRHRRAETAQPHHANWSPATWMPGWCRGCTITSSAACPWDIPHAGLPGGYPRR